ncbi:hypothetical protein ACFL1H_01500 [Nanoarchaeota archaeon]
MKLIKLIFIIFIFLLIINLISADRAYLLKFKYDDEILTYDSVTVKNMNLIEKPFNENHLYSIEYIDYNGETILKSSFTPKRDGIIIKGLPYDETVIEIRVKESSTNKVIYPIPVEHFADTCGNQICEGHESNEDCPDDCPSGSEDDFCDGIKDGICDPDCRTYKDPDCVEDVIGQAGGDGGDDIIDDGGDIDVGDGMDDIPGDDGDFDDTGDQVDDGQDDIQDPGQDDFPITDGPVQSPKKGFPLVIIVIGVFAVVIILLGGFVLKSRSEADTEEQTKISQYLSNYSRLGYNMQQLKQNLLKSGYHVNLINKVMNKLFRRK